MQAPAAEPTIELLTPAELAARWRVVTEHWVREHTRRGLRDPIPHVRLGRSPVYRWGSRELQQWFDRRVVQGRPGLTR